MKTRLLIIAAAALCAGIVHAQTPVTPPIFETNASGGVTVITDPIPNNPFTSTTVSNVIKSVPAGLTKVATDGFSVFKDFNFTNPISIGVFGLQNGKHYGGGLEANIVNTNSPVSAGFAVAAIQTETTGANGKKEVAWNFYDATLNLSISQVENIPILNLPVLLRIFSGPFASLNGGVLIGAQSGTSGDLNFDLPHGWSLNLGGGIVNCAGAAAANLKPIMPMAHVNLVLWF